MSQDSEVSEFEAAITKMLEMHLEKSKAYSPGTDPFQNFIDIGQIRGRHPIDVVEDLAAKHFKVIRSFDPNTAEPSKYTDDAFLDRAVYAVIALCLYERWKRDHQG